MSTSSTPSSASPVDAAAGAAPSSSPTDLAQALAGAWTGGPTLDDAPWRLPDDAAAYAAQAALAKQLGWRLPGRPEYWKCGGGSRDAALGHSALAPLGVREVRGLRNGGDFSDIGGSGASGDADGWRLFGAEAEIALRLGQDVTPEMAAALRPGQAEHLVEAMCVAIEWISSRWTRAMKTDPRLRLADAQSHGALALGPWQAWTPGRDWSAQACEMTCGTAAPLAGVGGHGLNDPAWVLAAWLQAATRDGATVAAGSVVTTGAWRIALDLAPGTLVTVRYEGLGELIARN